MIDLKQAAMLALNTALEQQQAEPDRWVIEKVGDKLLLNGKEIDPGTIEVRLDGLTYRSSEKMEVRQQAEPIGWLDGNDKLAEFMHRDLKAEHDKRGSATPKDFTIPVYTTLPQRKPLTDEEIEQAQRDVWRSLPSDFDYTTSSWIEIGIRYAEAAHGIKEKT